MAHVLCQLTNIMNTFATSGTLSSVNYFLGGKINDVPDDATAVHPGMRNAIWSVFPSSPDAQAALREFIPNKVTGVCFNHHSGTEPDWRDACWGANYAKLESIKAMYDPDHRFNCCHGVGYEGDEDPPNERSASFSPLDCPTSEATSMPTSTASLALQPLSSHSRRVFRRPDNFGPNCNENLATTCSMVGNLPVLLLPLVICYLLL